MDAHVALCIPSTGTWNAKTGHDIVMLVARSLPHIPLMLINHQNSSIGDGRNHMVLLALKQNASHVMFIDADMVFPEDGLLRLIAHDKDIVGATYNRRVRPYSTLGEWEPGPPKGLLRASKVPTGFLLIKTSVFGKMQLPWFFEGHGSEYRSEGNPTGHVSDDYVFCTRAVNDGFQPYIDFDLSFEIGHIGEQIVVMERPEGI